MHIYSFVRKGHELFPIEVELALAPGLPQFQIMGMADTAIKESQLRIKSALRSQGFELPKGSMVLINLKPPYLRKTSRGLDLAIACAYLWKTGQVQFPQAEGDTLFVYGELSLSGEVHAPDDIELLQMSDSSRLVTGALGCGLTVPSMQLTKLQDLHQPELVDAAPLEVQWQRPKFPNLSVGASAARVLKVIAVGGHAAMLAGPSGSGKTTMVDALYPMLSEPSSEEAAELYKQSKLWGESMDWRPRVAPHHSIPPMAMIGGGAPIFPGEISRANKGLLVLDEFLEFHRQVKEALREPIEKGMISVTRRGQCQKFAADFQLLATTNLCPCGDYVPGKFSGCRFSLAKCRSYMERLSGPLLDRFEVLAFSDVWLREKPEYELPQLLGEIEEARLMRQQRGQELGNNKLELDELQSFAEAFVVKELQPEVLGSYRRRLALWRVARTLADIEKSREINELHLDRAASLTIKPFRQMRDL